MAASFSVVVVIGADGGAKRAGGVTIVPVSSSKSTGVVRDSVEFGDDAADDAVLSMCTDNEGDELLTSAFTDAMMSTGDQSSA